MANKKIAAKRYRWLHEKGITMTDFAAKTHDTLGTVYFWFKLGRTPRGRYLANVMKAFPDWPVK